MSNNALYIYGMIKSYDKNWKENGMGGNNVFLINEGEFSAIVHCCNEKPYNPANPDEIKDLIITHNEVLDKSIKDFGAVIPLSFNTIIKTSNKKTAEENLRNWLKDNEEDLINIWNQVNGKEEYGIRIYYEKEKLLKKIEEFDKIKQLQQKTQIESAGIAYLLKGKIKDETNQIAQKQIFEYKQKFYNDIKNLVFDITINPSKILLDEEKDLLFSISILVNKEQIQKVKNYLVNSNFYFNIAGPFAPYSFVSLQKSLTSKSQNSLSFDDAQNSETLKSEDFDSNQKSLVSETPKPGGFCRNEQY